MIMVKKAPAGYIAQMYVEVEPGFNLEMEQSLETRRLAGDAVAKPCPPYTHYGPGGHRFINRTFLEETGEWCPTLEEAVASVQSKKLIKASQARIERAKRKLEWEEKRLAGLLGKHRIFDNDSGEEIK